MNDYPRMLFRAGSECRVWDLHDVDTRIVADEEEHLAAMDDGWCSSPADIEVASMPRPDPVPVKKDKVAPKG